MNALCESAFRYTSIAALALGCLAAPAGAQEYPSKPIRIVLEFAAGAGGDVNLRVVTGQASQFLGQPVVIENRAGAGGVVAAETAIRAAPDGYTLLGATPNAIIVRPALTKSSHIDLGRDLTPVALLWNTASLVLTSTNVPVKSMKELIDYARANPDRIAYGTTGVGTHHHLNGEQLQQFTGIKLRHVPYKANAQAFADLVSGDLPMVIGLAATAVPFLKSGKIRVLAIVDKRVPAFPDVPAISELVPGFSAAPSWTGLFGPAKLPAPIVRRLNTDFNKALNTQEVRSREGFQLTPMSPEEFQAQIQKEFALVAKIVKDANIRVSD
jgi:tripartite-type tricarboxylate transporter receptor subunit TctC